MPDPIEIPPSEGPLVGGKKVSVFLGPYAGQVLVMPTAEADQAIADHWASELVMTVDAAAEPHPPLTQQEREAALLAAQTWAANVRGEALPEPIESDTGERDEFEQRDMTPGEPGDYATRDMPVRRGPGRPPKIR